MHFSCFGLKDAWGKVFELALWQLSIPSPIWRLAGLHKDTSTHTLLSRKEENIWPGLLGLLLHLTCNQDLEKLAVLQDFLAAGEAFGGFAHLTTITFRILLSLIPRTNLCYWVCRLQCKEVIPEYSVLSQIWSLPSNLSNCFCYFWTKKKITLSNFTSPWGSRGTFLLLWLDLLFSQMICHFSHWQEQQSVEINFRIWKLILGCSQYFSMKFIIK